MIDVNSQEPVDNSFLFEDDEFDMFDRPAVVTLTRTSGRPIELLKYDIKDYVTEIGEGKMYTIVTMADGELVIVKETAADIEVIIHGVQVIAPAINDHKFRLVSGDTTVAMIEPMVADMFGSRYAVPYQSRSEFDRTLRVLGDESCLVNMHGVEVRIFVDPGLFPIHSQFDYSKVQPGYTIAGESVVSERSGEHCIRFYDCLLAYEYGKFLNSDFKVEDIVRARMDFMISHGGAGDTVDYVDVSPIIKTDGHYVILADGFDYESPVAMDVVISGRKGTLVMSLVKESLPSGKAIYSISGFSF